MNKPTPPKETPPEPPRGPTVPQMFGSSVNELLPKQLVSAGTPRLLDDLLDQVKKFGHRNPQATVFWLTHNNIMLIGTEDCLIISKGAPPKPEACLPLDAIRFLVWDMQISLQAAEAFRDALDERHRPCVDRITKGRYRGRGQTMRPPPMLIPLIASVRAHANHNWELRFQGVRAAAVKPEEILGHDDDDEILTAEERQRQ